MTCSVHHVSRSRVAPQHCPLSSPVIRFAPFGFPDLDPTCEGGWDVPRGFIHFLTSLPRSKVLKATRETDKSRRSASLTTSRYWSFVTFIVRVYFRGLGLVGSFIVLGCFFQCKVPPFLKGNVSRGVLFLGVLSVELCQVYRGAVKVFFRCSKCTKGVVSPRCLITSLWVCIASLILLT